MPQGLKFPSEMRDSVKQEPSIIYECTRVGKLLCKVCLVYRFYADFVSASLLLLQILCTLLQLCTIFASAIFIELYTYLTKKKNCKIA